MLYYFIETASIAGTCKMMKYTIIKQMAEWIPIKWDLLSFYENDTNPEIMVFRQIWFTSHAFIGLFSLFSIILMGFFLLDMFLTWRHPLYYMSAQKHVIPVFLSGSKIGQGVLFIILSKYLRWVEGCLVGI
jgi:hypothetical protein